MLGNCNACSSSCFFMSGFSFSSHDLRVLEETGTHNSSYLSRLTQNCFGLLICTRVVLMRL